MAVDAWLSGADAEEQRRPGLVTAAMIIQW